MGSDQYLLCLFCKYLSVLLSRKRMFVMLWSGLPRLGVFECSLLKSCVCAKKIDFWGKNKVILQGHPYLDIVCG